MIHIAKEIFVIAIAFFFTTGFSATRADAERAYVEGRWKESAQIYEQVCPTLADSLKTECTLWNILALSQTRDAKDFSKAGKKLDSLIEKTNPQDSSYADLFMTKSQFQMFMGRFEKAGDALVKAIETSLPRHVPVLKKVCAAVKSKVKSQTLEEACAKLDETTTSQANPAPAVGNNSIKTSSSGEAPVSSASLSESASESSSATTSDPSRDAKKKEIEAPAKSQEVSTTEAKKEVSSERWILQLGVFGQKTNAENLSSMLKKKSLNAKIEPRVDPSKTLYIVYIDGFSSREQAIDFAAKKITPLNMEFQPVLKK